MEIKKLTKSDLSSIHELQPADWYDILPIITYYTEQHFCFPLKAMLRGKMVGIGTAIIHEEVAWLGHIIVHPSYRNRGFGQLLTESLINLCYAKNCQTIRLIATDLGAPVYQKLGFRTDTEYLFFRDITDASIINEAKCRNIISYTNDWREKLIELDFSASGEKRFFHLEKHLQNAWIYVFENHLQAYYLPQFGDGLIVADNPEAGIALMKFRFFDHHQASFPRENTSAKEWLYARSYKEFKTAKRMSIGKPAPWKAEMLYNRIGGNLG